MAVCRGRNALILVNIIHEPIIIIITIIIIIVVVVAVVAVIIEGANGSLAMAKAFSDDVPCRTNTSFAEQFKFM